MADPLLMCLTASLYVYPSHDWEAGAAFDDDGGHFQMKDYHVISMEDVENGEVTDHGMILHVDQVKWAEKQMWDNDVVEKDGKYFLIFSAKDYNGVFHLGVAIADKPEGPFIPRSIPSVALLRSIPVCSRMTMVRSIPISADSGVDSSSGIRHPRN